MPSVAFRRLGLKPAARRRFCIVVQFSPFLSRLMVKQRISPGSMICVEKEAIDSAEADVANEAQCNAK